MSRDENVSDGKISDDRVPTPGDGDDPPTAGTTADPFAATVRAALAASAAQHSPAPDLQARIEALAAERSRRHPRWVLAGAAAVLVMMVLVGVVIGRGDPDRMVTMGPSTDPGTSSLPAAGPMTAVATPTPDDGGTPRTEAPTPATTTTVAPSRAPVTIEVPTSATATTATTTPLDPSAILQADGLAGVPFGGSTAAAEQAITARIGPPTSRFADRDCSARQIVSWGSFALWDQSGTFVRWELIGDAAVGLKMDRGGGIGAAASALLAVYPEAKLGPNEAAFPVRRVLATTGRDGSEAWSAILGPDDRVVAMHATDASLWPEGACFGRDAVNFSLQPHTDGLGMIAFGAPVPRVAAAIAAVYGDAGGSSVDADGCNEVVTTRYGPSPFVSVVAFRGTFIGYRMPEPGNGVPMGVQDEGGQVLRTGMTIGEVRVAFGDRVSVGGTPGPDGSYPVTIRPVASDGGTALIAGATGTEDTAPVTTVGAMRPPPC